MQRALWGLIPPGLKAIAVGWEGGVVRARFVYDHQPSAEDWEIVREVEAYVFADFDPGLLTDFTAVVAPAGPIALIPHEGWWAYVRRED
jgi:hypothetical protein